MSVNLNVKETLDLSKTGRLVGLNIGQRIEIILACLLKNTEIERLTARVITVLMIKHDHRMWFLNRRDSRPADGFDYWASCEILSIDDLFYAYIGFANNKAVALERCTLKKEIECLKVLGDFDDMHFFFTFCSMKLPFSYINYSNCKDLDSYQTIFKNSPPEMKGIKYNKYLKSLGRKTDDDIPVTDS